MQVIIYETDEGVAYTLDSSINFPVKRLHVVHAFKGFQSYLSSGVNPMLPDVPNPNYSLDYLYNFLMKDNIIFAELNPVAKFAAKHLKYTPGAKLPMRELYAHYCAQIPTENVPSQVLFTRQIRNLERFTVRNARINGAFLVCVADVTYSE